MKCWRTTLHPPLVLQRAAAALEECLRTCVIRHREFCRLKTTHRRKYKKKTDVKYEHQQVVFKSSTSSSKGGEKTRPSWATGCMGCRIFCSFLGASLTRSNPSAHTYVATRKAPRDRADPLPAIINPPGEWSLFSVNIGLDCVLNVFFVLFLWFPWPLSCLVTHPTISI